ncbi:MAG: DUF2892 domain-containing protein [bacterium]
MKKNIGTFDRVMRALTGMILVALMVFVVMPLWTKIILGIVALFCFFQALMSWCLFYQLIGKNTCPIE